MSYCFPELSSHKATGSIASFLPLADTEVARKSDKRGTGMNSRDCHLAGLVSQCLVALQHLSADW